MGNLTKRLVVCCDGTWNRPDQIESGLAAPTNVAKVALAFALLAIEYALFTTAITIYVVLLTDTLGASAFESAGERALGTALGIIVAALALRVFGEAARDRPSGS